MKTYVALLRAVNVGGTGKLPMTTLLKLCKDAGFVDARTYIASGNVVLRSNGTEAQVRSALEKQLHHYAGKPVGVIVRSAAEIAAVVARNPFRHAPASRVIALFVDERLPRNPFEGAAGAADERIELGKRELFLFYPTQMGGSRLRIPAQKVGTGRNMNTVARLAEMSQLPAGEPGIHP